MGQFATCVVLGGGRERGTEHLAKEEGEEFFYFYFCPSYIAPPFGGHGKQGTGGLHYDSRTPHVCGGVLDREKGCCHHDPDGSVYDRINKSITHTLAEAVGGGRQNLWRSGKREWKDYQRFVILEGQRLGGDTSLATPRWGNY